MGLFDGIKSTLGRLVEEGQQMQAEKVAREREAFDVAANNFINGYGEDFHCTDEQFIRFDSVRFGESIGKVESVNKKKLCAQIRSSCKTDTVYSVSLTECTCPDFQQRKLPCKHMYKLALELGIVTKDWDLSGIPDAIKELFSSLSYTDKVKYLRLINKYNGCEYFDVPQKDISVDLLECGFLEDHTFKAANIDKYCTRNDIIAALTAAHSPYASSITSRTTKSEMIRWISENDERLLNKLGSKHYTICFSSALSPYLNYIYRHYQYLL